MKQKLMKALNSLPMTIKDKEDFVNTIVDNCNKEVGGDATIEYYKLDWVNGSTDSVAAPALGLTIFFSYLTKHFNKDEGITIITGERMAPDDYKPSAISMVYPTTILLYKEYTINSYDDFIKALGEIITETGFPVNIEEFKNAITKYIIPITKEEFYKID